MSLFSYRQSIKISISDPDFDTLIMAAMRKADTYNMLELMNSFPSIYRELHERYNAPGGVLVTDQ